MSAGQNTPTWATEDTEVTVDREQRTHPSDRGVRYGRVTDQWTHYSEAVDGATIGVELSGFRHDDGDDFADSVLVWEAGGDGLGLQRLCLLADDARRLAVQLQRAADLLDGAGQ